MCGRFTLATPDELIAEAFGIEAARMPQLEPRYNVAPTQPIAIVHAAAGERGRLLESIRWGWIPHWASPDRRRPLINVRDDSLADSRAFRDALRHRRCLIVADGFYEWRHAGSASRQPFHFALRSRGVFGMAGLWDPQRGNVGGCVIVTTAPNALVTAVHDRMPAIVSPDDYARWLDPTLPAADVLVLLRSYPADAMDARAVAATVNNARVDSPHCLDPA